MFKPSSGRKKESPVWSHFEYDGSLDKSRCLITIAEKPCGQFLLGKNTTNLRNHLKSKHKEVFAALVIAESQAKRPQDVTTTPTVQAKLKVCLTQAQKSAVIR